ncbi:MAG: cation transporter [Mycobacterium sp.]|nr:cation transporter [Mycobacterium sp.]
MSSPEPKTSQSDVGPDGAEDVQSDPAKGADEKSDWSDEGGATPEGPADEGEE